MDAIDAVSAINMNIVKIFANWPEETADKKEVLKGIEAIMLENVFDIPRGQIVEVTDGANIFNSYYPGMKTEEIAREIRTSNPGWWGGVPRLNLRQADVKDETRFRVRIVIGEEEDECVVRNVQEAVSRFEFMLWETKAMPEYKNLTVEDEQRFKRTGVLRYGEEPGAPLLEVIR